VRIWDALTGVELQQLNNHTERVNSAAFSHDDIYIVSGSDDKSVQVWIASTGVELQQLNGHSGPVFSVAFSHDSTHIVSGSADKSVWVWNTLTGAALQKLHGHSDFVRSVAFSHDSTQIVSGSDDKSVRVWSRIYHENLWTSTAEGWIISLPDQNHLMWIPQGIREVMHHPYSTLIISQKGYAHINFQDCNLDTKWAECYKSPLV